MKKGQDCFDERRYKKYGEYVKRVSASNHKAILQAVINFKLNHPNDFDYLISQINIYAEIINMVASCRGNEGFEELIDGLGQMAKNFDDDDNRRLDYVRSIRTT